VSDTDPQSRGTLPPCPPLAAEEPALQQRENFLARERARVGVTPVLLEHPHVVLERVVRTIERVAQLVPLEHHVLRAGLVGLAKVRVDCTANRPHRTGATLDPDHDPLLFADVVDAGQRPLRVPAFTRASFHLTGIQSRLVSGFKNMFSFLFSRGSAEEHVARYVIREHERGRSLQEILEDRYVQNRLTPEQQKRLLDRPEVIETFSSDTLESAKAELPST
jgi:hypothetical protein